MIWSQLQRDPADLSASLSLKNFTLAIKFNRELKKTLNKVLL